MSAKVVANTSDAAAFTKRSSFTDLAVQITQLMDDKQRKEAMLFNPNGNFCTKWDPLMFLLLSFIAFSTPFEIGNAARANPRSLTVLLHF